MVFDAGGKFGGGGGGSLGRGFDQPLEKGNAVAKVIQEPIRVETHL